MITLGFSLTQNAYINNPNHKPLDESEIESCIIEVFEGYYDNASNGNRSRGGMKKASDLSVLPEPVLEICVSNIAIVYPHSVHSSHNHPRFDKPTP
jgi:hypothetical protein